MCSSGHWEVAKLSGSEVVVLKVLRGRYDDFVLAILRRIREHFSSKRLVFLVPRRALRWLPFSPEEVEKIVVMEGGGPNPFRALEVMRRLKPREVREVVLIYDNLFPLGSLKIEALALLLGKQRIWTFLREEGPKPRSRWWLLGRVLMGLLSLGFFLLLSVVAALFVAIIIGLFDLFSLPALMMKKGRQ